MVAVATARATKKWTLAQLDIVTVYDPARSRESEYGHLARSAIMTTGCSPEYEIFVLDYFVGRKSFDVIYSALKQQVARFKPRCIAIEDVATQIAIGDAFFKIAQLEDFKLPPLESLKPDSRINKKFRIKTTLQQAASSHAITCEEHHYELIAEWDGFPNGRTIDLLDVLAYAVMLHNIPDVVGYASYNEKIKERMREAKGGSGEVINLQDHRDTYNDPRYRVPTQPKDQAILRYA